MENQIETRIPEYPVQWLARYYIWKLAQTRILKYVLVTSLVIATSVLGAGIFYSVKYCL